MNHNTQPIGTSSRKSNMRTKVKSQAQFPFLLSLGVFCFALMPLSDAFSLLPSSSVPPMQQLQRKQGVSLMVYAPTGSGYASLEDEESELPDTYEPMMQYPGTMRPGKTPENSPYHDLPFLGDNDPEPVPWPHFQQIEWYHKWAPPHPHPIPMEQFIDMQGRWATPEMEAAMRAGARRSVRAQKEEEEQETEKYVVVDDEDDDEEDEDTSVPIELGDGMFGQLGSSADQAIVAAAVAPQTAEPVTTEGKKKEEEDTLDEATSDEDDLDDFLLDLGLDVDMGEDMDETEGEGDSAATETIANDIGDDDDKLNVDDNGDAIGFNVDIDNFDDTAIEGDDEVAEEIVETVDTIQTVPLEAFEKEEEEAGLGNTEDSFDDGGFDFGDIDDNGGGGGDFESSW